MYADINSYETLIDRQQRYIPEYYPYMHRDGFEPWEIQVALRKYNRRIYHEYLEAQQQAQAQEHELPMNVKFNVEIKQK